MDKNDLIQFEFYPSIEEVKDKDQFVKAPITQLAGLGAVFSQIATYSKTIAQAKEGGGTLYRVILPEGTHLAKLKDGTGYISSAIGNSGEGLVGQARLIPYDGNLLNSVDPTLICVAIMLMNIDRKLDKIQESQEKIISLIDTQEHGQIKGNIQFLYDIMSRAKYRWDDESFKSDYRMKTIDIKQDAYQNIEKYKERIEKELDKKHTITFVNDAKKLNNIVDHFVYYRLSIFMYCYASFIEVLLGNSFSSDNLLEDIHNFDQMSLSYKQLYTKAYDLLETEHSSSLINQSINMFSKLSTATGKAISKIPLVEKGPVDEALESLGNNAKEFYDGNIQQSLEKLRNIKDLNILEFKNQYEKLNRIYNEKIIYMIDDKDNVYLNYNLIA